MWLLLVAFLVHATPPNGYEHTILQQRWKMASPPRPLTFGQAGAQLLNFHKGPANAVALEKFYKKNSVNPAVKFDFKVGHLKDDAFTVTSDHGVTIRFSIDRKKQNLRFGDSAIPLSPGIFSDTLAQFQRYLDQDNVASNWFIPSANANPVAIAAALGVLIGGVIVYYSLQRDEGSAVIAELRGIFKNSAELCILEKKDIPYEKSFTRIFSLDHVLILRSYLENPAVCAESLVRGMANHKMKVRVTQTKTICDQLKRYTDCWADYAPFEATNVQKANISR